MATTNVSWTRAHTLAAFHLYTLLPFGRLSHGTPEIKQLAEWQGRTANSLAMKLSNFASLDPQVTARGRRGLPGASSQDRALWNELKDNWDTVAAEAAEAYDSLARNHGAVPNDDLIVEETNALFPEGQTRGAIVQVRVNQSRFRQSILASYNSTCCISGLKDDRLLIASHIVPWSEDSKNRLNPQNGLCLSALHDKAYDIGLITVMPDYRIRVSKKVLGDDQNVFAKDTLWRYDNQSIRLPEKFRPGPEFLIKHATKFGFC